MTLQEELQAMREKASSGDFFQIHETVIEDLRKTDKLANVPVIGSVAPPFNLPDEENHLVSSTFLLKKGPLIISFFRGDWCAFCNLELRALQRSLAEFQKFGASLVGISPQAVSYSHMMADRRNVQYQVLSDSGNKIADSYGLMFTMPNELQNAYKAFGIDIAQINNNPSSAEVPVPATFVVNTDGLISYRFVDADYTKRAEPSEIIANLMTISA
ncbi:MAG TPA: alkyl hydroperoxide reductase [Microscillaceae bacterium]|nr:alkyl hydroperoxide reductase [Microscillaceae bacterium]